MGLLASSGRTHAGLHPHTVLHPRTWRLFRIMAFLVPVLLSAVPPIAAETLTLADCIQLALKENRTIKNAYLERVSQKYLLQMAEDTFVPTLSLTTGPRLSGTAGNLGAASGAATGATTTTTTSSSLTAIEKIPTGATLTLSGTFDTSQRNVTGKGWNITLEQPLLKNAGLDVNLESVRAAREQEQKNILALKATLMDTLTNVITAYRSYAQSIKSLENNRQSLQRSKELLATNRELIAAGRMAAIEIIQSEADLARQEYDLLAAENSLDKTRLSLTKAIDIDKNRQISPVQETTIPPLPYTLEQALQLAFENRPDYQQLLLDYARTKRAVTIAKRNTLWDLSLTGNYANDYLNSNGSWYTGMQLTIPLDNLYRSSSDRQAYLAADINRKKFENDLAKRREEIEIEIQDALRSAEMSHRQIKLATLSRTLSEKKVEIETEKLKAGRSTNFQLVSFQNDLKQARQRELDAITDYLNALTTLDKTLGVTLDRLGVALVDRN